MNCEEWNYGINIRVKAYVAEEGGGIILSVLVLLLSNSLFLSLRLSGTVGSFPKPLSAEEERRYLELSRQGDIRARNILVEHNLRLVAHVIKKYYTQYDQQEDLISIGTIGLIKGISSFDGSKGARLATYAAKCVENAILSQMRLWFPINPPRAEKHQNGVFWHKFPRMFTSFVPLRTAM